MTGAFLPVPWLPGRHLETIVPALFPARAVRAPETDHVVRVASDAAVGIRVARPAGAPRGTLLLVHGMSGSIESGYMRRTAELAVDSGWVVARMNCRNCGGTEALSRTLYNAGQSEDVGHVLEALAASGAARPLVAVGFSLGGSLVLRYAGIAGRACSADAVAALNPPVDLEACCRALERPENAVYHAHFTLALCRHLRRIRALRRVAGPAPSLRRVRTLRGFDTTYTAPDAGYASAEEYYAGASAAPHLEAICVPALVISSENDPFVPIEMFAPFRALPSRHLRFLHPRRGGHLGYWQAGAPRFWASAAVLDFVESSLPRA